jgi:hypothetical protein
MCIFRKLNNNKVRKNGLNNHLNIPKNVLFDAHGLKLQHLVNPMKIMEVQ